MILLPCLLPDPSSKGHYADDRDRQTERPPRVDLAARRVVSAPESLAG